MMDLIGKFKAAKRASIPLMAIETADPQQTMKRVFNEYKQAPIVQWDAARGAIAWNVEGAKMLAEIVGGACDDDGTLPNETREMIADATTNLSTMLDLAAKFRGDKKKAGSILFILNAYRFIDQPVIAQAIWNLRDQYKANNRSLVLLSPQLTLPAELKNDVFVFNEPLPVDSELEEIIVKTYKAGGLAVPENGVLRKAVDAVAGLAAFPAENSAAMSLTKSGIDMDILGAQKRQQVSGIPGAELWAGRETFANVIGCRNMVSLYKDLLANERERFRLIFFMDEIEKAVAGAKGDTSGTSQGVSEQFLTWSQNSGALGLIAVGIPGAGKSLSAKAAAGEFGLPLLMASLSKVKGSLVGETERNMALLLKTADAIAAGGRVLMIATSNDLSSISPEMQARFRLGCYFFDYPAEAERAAMWAYYRAKYSIEDSDIPESRDWVGREIESCCELAYLLRKPLKVAAKRIVPVSVAKRAEMEALRQSSSGKFVSADYDGVFKCERASSAPIGSQSSGRSLAVDA
jgi:hypothetical protein